MQHLEKTGTLLFRHCELGTHSKSRQDLFKIWNITEAIGKCTLALYTVSKIIVEDSAVFPRAVSSIQN